MEFSSTSRAAPAAKSLRILMRLFLLAVVKCGMGEVATAMPPRLDFHTFSPQKNIKVGHITIFLVKTPLSASE
jgi:hypothetical protein